MREPESQIQGVERGGFFYKRRPRENWSGFTGIALAPPAEDFNGGRTHDAVAPCQACARLDAPGLSRLRPLADRIGEPGDPFSDGSQDVTPGSLAGSRKA